MDTLSTPHDPSVVIINRRYPIFPEERGPQDHVVSLDIRDIKVNFRFNRSEFYRYPSTVVDFRM